MPYKSMTRVQVRSLLTCVKDERHRTGLLIAYLHGLRVSEMNQIRVRDTTGGCLSVKRLKLSKPTLQPFFPSSDPIFDEATQIKQLIEKLELGPDDVLFDCTRQNYDLVIKKAGRLAALPEALCHMHCLKHSIAYHLADGGLPIRDLQTFLGHVSMASTGIYLESTDAQASAAAHRILVVGK